ncbi:NADH-quinone oxidoreductase subunit C [Janibacter sp. G56]|uniref:NADH-quinone oxidoreductase subunit C n=1 Tax=Janibacter sp. G56 TaxID=3418717 RepID=UPI003D05DD6F
MTTTERARVDARDWHASVTEARAAGHTFFDWLSAVDRTHDETAPGFDVVVHLLDVTHRGNLRATLLTTRVADGEALASITDLYPGAAWHERETHEMFGIGFDGFDDGTGLGLRPLLLPEGFIGTPLRKSFVLAARASKVWPGGKEPGEGPEGSSKAPSRRKVAPPGVPDPQWGPR